MTKLLKTLPVALGLVGILSGCGVDSRRDVRLGEYVLGDGRSRVELIQNIVSFGADYYTMNIYGCNGDLVCSIADNYINEDHFVIKEDSLKRNISGLELKGK